MSFRRWFDRQSWKSRTRRAQRRTVRLESLEDRRVLATINVPADFSTIQAAVNAANTGDTIDVASGTYSESVTINKSITVDGAQAGVAATGRSGPESILDATSNSGDTLFNVAANDVTINGFTVQNQTNVNHFGAGIYIEPGYHGTQILDNIVQDNVIGLFLANNSAADPAAVEGNLFQNNTQSGPAGGTDIYADQFTAGAGGVQSALIQGNTFTNSTSVENSWGIGISNTGAAPFTNISVADNNFSNAGRGMYFYGTTNSSITGNTITGASHYAIGAFGGDNGFSITGNTLSNDATGLFLEDDIGTNAMPDPNQNFHVNQNSFLGNTTNINVSSAGSSSEGYLGTLDATHNWWGSPSGPAPGSVIGSVNTSMQLLAAPGHSSILLLGQSGLSATGNANVAVAGTLVVDAQGPQAAVATGNATVSASDAFYVSGGTSSTGHGTLPPPVAAAPTSDPLATLPVPSQPATVAKNLNVSGKSQTTLTPGTYLGGIQVSGQAAVKLEPGIYYLTGPLTVSGQATVITDTTASSPDTGNGVLIYFAAPGGQAVSISGQASVNLAAPTAGTYMGISIFENPASKGTISVTSGSLTTDGTVYAAAASVQVTGNGSLVLDGPASTLIAASLSATGNAKISVS